MAAEALRRTALHGRGAPWRSGGGSTVDAWWKTGSSDLSHFFNTPVLEHGDYRFFGTVSASKASCSPGGKTIRIYPNQARTSSRKSVLSKPHFRNRSWYESSKLSMHFFKLEPEILICLPLVPKLIKNQSGSSLSSLNLLCKHHDRVINATL